jgi:hypothetical protein
MRLFYVRGLGVWVTYTIMITSIIKNKRPFKKNFNGFCDHFKVTAAIRKLGMKHQNRTYVPDR